MSEYKEAYERVAVAIDSGKLDMPVEDIFTIRRALLICDRLPEWLIRALLSEIEGQQ